MLISAVPMPKPIGAAGAGATVGPSLLDVAQNHLIYHLNLHPHYL